VSKTPSDKHLYALVGALVLIALAIFLFKVLILGFPLTPNKEVDLWDVEARLAFVARGEPVKATLLIPRDTRRYAVVDENFISRGYGLTTAPEDGNRQVVWSKRSASGKQVLYYRASVRQIQNPEPPGDKPAPTVKMPELSGAANAAARALTSTIREQSADVETMVSELLKRLNAAAPDESVAVLLGKNANALKKLKVAVQVLAYAGVPARIVHGIRLTALERDAPTLHWLQVYYDKIWRSFDPSTGKPSIPDDYFTWWRGMQPLIHVQGGSNIEAKISVSLNKEAALSGAAARSQRFAPGLVEYSLFGLPIETQAIYHVLLMIPIGAFLLVVMRNVVGVKTFGTFMPVLIALAFRETQLVWGVFLFSLVVALGLSVRFYLEQLRLLLVPRLASVLIVVVLLMAALSVISHKLGLHQGLSIALFPMVILTMTIERMSIVWEERGAGEALEQGLGSLVVAALAYLVMNIDTLQHVVFLFPELLLLLLAGTLLLGRYSGYRLSELWRFKVLARNE
jgi:hypothetical protein